MSPHRKIFWLAFDGAGYGGWQLQRRRGGAPEAVDLDAVVRARFDGHRPPGYPDLSVQVVLDAALSRVNGGETRSFGSSRTDRGVHALAMLAHADFDRLWDNDRLRHALNGVLPPDIRIVEALDPPTQDFLSRRDALAKQYLYRIRQGRGSSPLHHGRVWQIWRPLDHKRMHAAGQLMVGKHDFNAFRSRLSKPQDTVVTIDDLRVVRVGDEIRVTVRASRFLRHMVRTMVAALVGAADGDVTEAMLRAALDGGKRSDMPKTAPPDGLYLAATWVRGLGWWDGMDLL